MKKVIIIGCPGSGKSTFARKLKDITGLPLYHLDMMFWNEDKTTVSRAVLTQRIRTVMQNPGWIIDGNYGSTMEMRFKECDTVFFLDYPLEVCLDGIESRRGKIRSDMPWVETETDEEFIEYVKSFNENHRPQIIDLIKKYPEKNVIIFRSREETETYKKDKKNE